MARTFRPGQLTVADAAALTAMSRDVNRFSRLTVQPPLKRFEAAGNIVIGGGAGGGGGFPARVTASALVEGVPVAYRIEETETDPDTLLPRAKEDGRVGPAFRGPTEEIDPPAIPVGQGVWATESVSVTLDDVTAVEPGLVEDDDDGVYDITPWGGQYRQTRERLVRVEGQIFPNPEDCTGYILAVLNYFATERLAARDLCGTVAPAGEGDTGGT